MTFDPVTRRMQAVQAIQVGESVAQVAIRHGVSRAVIYLWLDRWEATGWEGLRAQPGVGRRGRLTRDQWDRVSRWHRTHAAQSWSQVARWILHEFGVCLFPGSVRAAVKRIESRKSRA